MTNFDIKRQSRNLVAALSYSVFFITGIVVYFAEKDDKFVRFHAMQSIIVFGGLFALSVIVGIILGPFNILGIISNLINIVIWIVWVIVWLVSMVRAYQGQIFKWPIAGDWAEKRVG